MSIQALVLALTAVIRPTSAAALVAILRTKDPQRLLAAYLAGGLAFSVGVGALVVTALSELPSADSGSVTRPVLGLVLGVCALAYAAAVGIGLLPRRTAEDLPAADSWMRRRLHHLKPSTAATAGVLTHLPGLVYLAALNLIVVSSKSVLIGVVQVLIYNGIWFSMAIAALVLSVRRPGAIEELLDTGGSWVRDHQRVLTVVVCAAMGAYLVVDGTLELIRHPTLSA